MTPLSAVARGARAAALALRPAETGHAVVAPPVLAVVDRQTLKPVLSPVPGTESSPAIVGQMALSASARVIELHEVPA